ncbi:MAG: isoprenylcysteine carboxylmethyltransferase family protein [Deltaproteobacteria bacterium]|nr:isoprenylcysteine carboxylmethyltransferase family protein [Deltaproteobacteria bacterium]MBW2360185.1 isoprenylcysteine carboxylmethyltransferase family protein [Deltaproteobacteria bacterium]
MSSDSQAEGAAVRFPPPLVPVIGLAAGELLHRFVWPLPLPVTGVLRVALAALLLAAGIALILAAAGLFRKTGQDPKPWKPSPEIISDGVYRFTRNPMYVSMGLLQAGLGVALADGWVVALVPPVWLVIYLIAIRHEEAYLERKFGGEYQDYKRAVRRWL